MMPNVKVNIISFSAFIFAIHLVFSFEYDKDEIPFYSFGSLYTSEISSGIHFQFNFTQWAHEMTEILQKSYNFMDSENCIQKLAQNEIHDCFPETEVGQLYMGTTIEEVTVISHEECFQQCMNIEKCQFISVRPQKPWTSNPITMKCILREDFQSKSGAGSYVSAFKICGPRNDTFTSCTKNFEFDSNNPIHRMFRRKMDNLENQLDLLFDTILDMDPARLYANRKRRKVDFSLNLNLKDVTNSIFTGLFNIFHFPTLKRVLRNQITTIHEVQLNSNRTQILFAKMVSQEERIQSHDKDHYLINMADILDLANQETTNMVNTIKTIYEGKLDQTMIDHKIANKALDKVQYKLSTIGLKTVQKTSLDLYTSSKTDFFFQEGQIHLFSHIDGYSEKSKMNLFKLANLPVAVNNSLFEIKLENHFLAVSDALTDKDAWYVVLSYFEFQNLKKIGPQSFIFKDPNHRQQSGQNCLINLFSGHNLEKCNFKEVPEANIQDIYIDYLTEKNLVFFTPNHQIMGIDCNGQFIEKTKVIGYTQKNPPHLCQIIVSDHKFQSRFIDFNITFESRFFNNTSDLFQEEIEIFETSTPNNHEKNSKEFDSLFEDFNATHTELQNDRDIFEQEAEDDISANEQNSSENRLFIIGIIILIALFAIFVFYLQMKDKIYKMCCCCCNRQPAAA